MRIIRVDFIGDEGKIVRGAIDLDIVTSAGSIEDDTAIRPIPLFRTSVGGER